MDHFDRKSASLLRSHAKANEMCKRILSPQAGYIRGRVTQLKDIVNDHHQDNEFKLVKIKSELQQMSHEKDRAKRLQVRNLDTLEQMAEEVKYLSKKLESSEDKAQQSRNSQKKMKLDLERIMDVNGSLEGRIANVYERLLKVITQFRRQYLPATVDCDEINAIEKYIRYLEQLLEDATRRTEAQAARGVRISKQLDALIVKYKALEAESFELSQQLDIQTKQRQIEQIDIGRLQDQFTTNLNHQQLKLKKMYEMELQKVKQKAERRKIKNIQLKNELNEALKLLNKGSSSSNELAEQIEDVNAQNHLLNEQLQELKSMLGQASHDMGQLEDQYSQLKTHLLEVQRELVRRNSETQQYRTSLKTAVFQLETNEHELKVLRDKLLDYERKYDNQEEQSSRAQKQLTKVDDQCHQLRRENKQLKESVEDLRRIVSKQQQMMIRHKKQRDQMELNVDSNKDKDKVRRKDFLDRMVQLEKSRDSPNKSDKDKSHKLKLIGELQSMVKTHKQIYQAEQEKS